MVNWNGDTHGTADMVAEAKRIALEVSEGR